VQFFLNSIFYSYAQVLFSNRRWLGALILAASFAAPGIAAMSLLGVVLTNLIAWFLKFEPAKIESGFYGFNGILFSAATVFFFNLTPLSVVLIPLFVVITFFIAVVLENYLAVSMNLPGLTLPFVIALFIYMIFLGNFHDITPAVHATDAKYYEFLPEVVRNFFRSVALLFFQPNITTGLLITLGVLFFSRALFLLGVSAWLVATLFLTAILPHRVDDLGLIVGFNAVITSFALGGSLVLPSAKSYLLALIAAVMVVIVTAFFAALFESTTLPVLVLPFNFITLSTIYSLKFRKEQTDLVLLYFKPGSPEENLYHHRNRLSRFGNFKLFFPELPVWGEWTVTQAFDGEHTHKDKWRYAWDFVLTENGEEFAGKGERLEDYYCYGIPVSAPLSGKVVRISDGIPDNEIGEIDLEKNWGNTIILDHGEGLFSALSHLKPGSIKVKEGDTIEKGEIIANCGNSGRSPYPHLHFQFQTDDSVGGYTHKFPFSFYLERGGRIKQGGEIERSEAGTQDGEADRGGVAERGGDETRSSKTERGGDELVLKAFDFPEKAAKVQNIEKHKTLGKAFNFKYGDTFSFVYEVNTRGDVPASHGVNMGGGDVPASRGVNMGGGDVPASHGGNMGGGDLHGRKRGGLVKTEEWKTGIDVFNNPYIESSAGAVANFYNTGKVFYFSSFSGNKDSALYCLYLAARRVPLTLQKGLVWEDLIPVSDLPRLWGRYISEFFIFFTSWFEAKGKYRFLKREGEPNISLTGEVFYSGSGLFAGLKREYKTELTITESGQIESFSFAMPGGKTIRVKKNPEDKG